MDAIISKLKQTSHNKVAYFVYERKVCLSLAILNKLIPPVSIGCDVHDRITTYASDMLPSEFK